MSRGPEDNKHCILLSEKEGIYSDVCTNNNEKLWGNGIIPFIFNDNVTEELKNFVMEAMERIAKESIIKFVEREHQRDYIEIIDEGEFASYVGRKGGKQKLYVTIDKNKWPRPIGNAIHELMHVLGFFHEHCRPDRDRYVIVEKTGINYEKHTESCVIYFGPYDLKSIMHYSEGQGVTLKPEINAETGQRVKLSDGDKYALNELYPPEIIVSRLKEIYENLRKKIQSLFPENDPKYLKFKEREKLIKSREQELELLRVKKCEIVQVFERDYPKHRESEVIQDKINQEFNKVYMEKNRERNKTELIRLRNMEFDILKEIKDIDHPGYEIMRLTQNSVKRRKIDPSGSDARRKLMKLEFKILNIIHKEYKTLFNKLNQDEVCHREREMEDNIIRQEVSE